jgi:hypothetical protein
MEYDYYPGEWRERVAVNPDTLTVADLRVLLDDVSEQDHWPIVVHIQENDGYLTAYPVAVEVGNEKLVLRVQVSDPDKNHWA